LIFSINQSVRSARTIAQTGLDRDRRRDDDARRSHSKAEITIMATPSKRPMRDHKRHDDSAVRQMLSTATGRASKRGPDPHSVDNEMRQKPRPITLAPMPWDDAAKRT
jgi:hypothetical protein